MGSGSSQITTHNTTRRIEGDTSGLTLYALIRPPSVVRGAQGTKTIAPMDPTSEWVLNPAPGRDRTAKEDNVGTKVLQRNLAVSSDVDGDRIISAAFVAAHGLPKGLLAAVWASGRVQVLDVARTDVDATIKCRLPVNGAVPVGTRGAYLEEIAPSRAEDAPPLPPEEWGETGSDRNPSITHRKRHQRSRSPLRGT